MRQGLKRAAWVMAGVGLFVLAMGWPTEAQQRILWQLATGAATGTTETPRSASLSNSTAASTLTARSLSGVQLIERPTRWEVLSTPAVSNQATASIAAEAGVRHVVDCVTFSAGSTTAPALTALTVNLRDGATGAGTVIHQWQVVVANATGQNVVPFTECGLNLAGTTNTAMTLEFSALLTNLIESVAMTGYNLQ